MKRNRENKTINLYSRIQKLEEKIFGKKNLKETGEMSWHDLNDKDGEFYEAGQNLLKYARFLSIKTQGRVQVKRIVPYDKYLGAYVELRINGKPDKMWYGEIDKTFTIENLGIEGTVGELAKQIKYGVKESKSNLKEQTVNFIPFRGGRLEPFTKTDYVLNRNVEGFGNEPNPPYIAYIELDSEYIEELSSEVLEEFSNEAKVILDFKESRSDGNYRVMVIAEIYSGGIALFEEFFPTFKSATSWIRSNITDPLNRRFGFSKWDIIN